MATYCRISADNMREKLRMEKGWRENVEGRELVFLFNLKHHPVQIKVFSSIRLDTEVGRDVGRDAIRVCAVNTRTGQGWIKTGRVNRTTNWRDNLETKVFEVIEKSKARFNYGNF